MTNNRVSKLLRTLFFFKLETFDALKHREFRFYWLGFVISVSGQQMLWMIEGWLIYELSGSALLLGIHGAAQFLPSTTLTLFGGAIADKLDQRKILITVQMLFIVVLGGLALLGVFNLLTAWYVIGGGFLLSIVGAFEGPARQAMFPHLVSRDKMPSAVALNAMIHPGTRVIAPVIGGLVSAFVLESSGSASIAGGAVFGIAVVGVAIYAIMLMQFELPPIRRNRENSVFADMLAGLTYIRDKRIFAFLIGTAWYSMVFGISLTILFPIFAEDVLLVGPEGLGYLWGAMGIGSISGVFLASSRTLPAQQRSLLAGGLLLVGVFMTAFALSTLYWLSLFFVFLIGLGASVFNVAIQTNLQMLVDSEYRGRVMGIWSMVHTSIRPIGEFYFGSMAALFSAPTAFIVGAVFIIVFTVGYLIPSKQMSNLRDLREEALVNQSR